MNTLFNRTRISFSKLRRALQLFWHKVPRFLRKISPTCRVYRCFKYHKHNYTMRCVKIRTSRILQFFCNDYFKDLLTPITFKKIFSFLTSVVSTIFAVENALQSKNQFCMILWKSYCYVTLVYHSQTKTCFSK